MRKPLLRVIAVAGTLAIAFPAPGSAIAADQAAAPQTASQVSRERGVTITVKPRNLLADAKVWEFEVVLDTHTQELGDDLVRSVALLDAQGKPRTAAAWRGDPAGGHHRKGVVQFAPLSPVPEVVVLIIQRPGEPQPRTFRWQVR